MEEVLPQGDPWGFINLELKLLAEVLDGIEADRIAQENRLRQLTRVGPDADGQHRGLGLALDNPAVLAVARAVEQLKEAEATATKGVEKGFRKHPLYRWAQAQKGVGDKQAARMLMAIGDPYWNYRDDRPRKVSELWAYCGYGGDSEGRPQRRVKGQKANWSTGAKTKTYLVAEKCMMQRGKSCTPLQKEKPEQYPHAGDCTCGRYRLLYEAARMKVADRTHRWPCPPCGPEGKPAQPGSPLSQKHQHKYAVRLVAKEILLDAWLAAKKVHEGTTPAP